MSVPASLPLRLPLVVVLGVSLLGTACRKHDTDPKAAVDLSAASTSAPSAEETLTQKMWKAKDATEELAAQAKEAMGKHWEDFSKATFDQRVELRAHLSQAATRVDAEVRALAPKRDQLQGDARAAYDSAVKKLEAARAALTAELEQLNTASAETWNQAKKEAVQAWKRVEAAYQDVERSAET